MNGERGPTTEELRARVLADWPATTGVEIVGLAELGGLPASTNAALPRPCLACNREQGERMCDLCQRLEEAEASA